jgi:C-terminal binding-module, SLH-like, of glucodextranase
MGSVSRWGAGSTRIRTALAVVTAALALALAMLAAGGAQAAKVSPSLPAQQGTAPRPGPEVLYEPLAQAPQLENARGSGWRAKPILISGASAYRDGEFLYQGYLYDDHGAKEVPDPTNPMISPGGDPSGGDTFSEPDGTYTYPTGPGYDENAADIVELRVKPKGKTTAFRITLNTLENPSLVATAIAIGGTPGEPHPFPFGANVSAPAQYFLTVHGETASLTDASSGAEVSGPAPSVSVDLARRQITVEVPHSEWNPGSSTVRFAAGVGLWNAASGSYLLPGAVASATQPGGAGADTAPPAFFDVAFRFNAQEPLPGTPGAATVTTPAWWRESAQAQALASGDISAFHAEVDFAKLQAKADDDMPNGPTGVPQSGAFDRILASHFSAGQGADYATGGCGSSTACVGELRGQLLPYAIDIPSGAEPAGGWGTTLLLHSLSANYNQFAGSKNQSQFSARGSGSIVFTPSGRGPDGWYYDHAGADTFEVWADVAAHYRLNPSFTDIAGYSMGGYGTYKFASQFPDLFARAQPTVGPPALGIWVPPAEPTGGEQSLTQRMLASVRNVPFLIWDETTDELVPIAGVLEQVKAFDELGYRYEFDQFQAGEHLTLALNDEYAPAAAFLGTETIDADPAHVTYVYNPTMDFAADGTSAGHAYWVYDVGLRDSSGTDPLGTVDVRSQAFGIGDPVPGATQHGAGALTGGTIPAIPYTSQSKAWGPAPSEPARDVIEIKATNVAHVTIDAKRAKVDCNAQLNVTTDGPLTVTLAECHGKAKSITASFG